MSYLGVFGEQFWKTIFKFEIRAVAFVNNEFLTHIENFGISSLLFKVRGPLFLKVQIRVVCRRNYEA